MMNRIDITEQSEAGVSSKWIQRIGKVVLHGEAQKKYTPVSIVFVDDSFMTELNIKYFDKTESTDVISFFLDEDNFQRDPDSPWGEIYISVDRAKEQSDLFHVTYQNEIARLVIHGLLHLMGYEDKTTVEKNEMTEIENHYLNLLYKDMEE